MPQRFCECSGLAFVFLQQTLGSRGELERNACCQKNDNNGRSWVCSLHSCNLYVHAFDGGMPLNLLSATAWARWPLGLVLLRVP